MFTMPIPLRVLLVEDSQNDAVLLERELTRADYAVVCERVETAEALRQTLDKNHFDIVIADYSLPSFNGLQALAIIREVNADIPFLLISGTVGEEIAVSAMRAGANDYILKANLARIPSAVARELRQVRVRIEGRHALEALHRSEHRFRNLVEQATDSIVVHDFLGKIVDVNSRTCSALGYTREELVGRTISDIEATYTKERLTLLWKKIAAHGTMIVNGILRRKDGTHFPVEVNIGTFEADTEKLLIAIVRDVTERKRQEEALRRSEAQYRLLFESNPHPLYVYDNKTLEFLAVNEAAVKKYGYSREEFLGMNLRTIYSADDFIRFQKILRQPGDSNGGVDEQGEWKHFRKDGTLMSVEIISHPIIFEGKAAELVLSNDITEKVKAQEMKEKLIRDVSHELKTPIAMIEMAVDMLSRALEADNAGAVIRAHHIIDNNIKRLHKDVYTILDFSARTQGKGNVPQRRVRLRDIIEEIQNDFKDSAAHKGLVFTIKIDAFSARKQVFYNDIKTVLYNLVDNAVKFTSQGCVSVNIKKLVKGLQIQVADSGCGIEESNQKKLFLKFYKRHPSLPGTGLGLSIVREIVLTYKGTLRVDSKGEGQGCRITVVLPIGEQRRSDEKNSHRRR